MSDNQMCSYGGHCLPECQEDGYCARELQGRSSPISGSQQMGAEEVATLKSAVLSWWFSRSAESNSELFNIACKVLGISCEEYNASPPVAAQGEGVDYKAIADKLALNPVDGWRSVLSGPEVSVIISALLAAAPQPTPPAQPSRAEQIHATDCPKVWAFYEKYALGGKQEASCLSCGKVGKRAIEHLELPDIYVCESCRQPAEEIRDAALEGAAVGVTDPPDADSNWTAGIDLPGHGHAIECYGETKAIAEARRDAVLRAIALTPTAPQDTPAQGDEVKQLKEQVAYWKGLYEKEGLPEVAPAQGEVVALPREVFDEAVEFVDRHSEDWYLSGQALLAKLKAAIAAAQKETK